MLERSEGEGGVQRGREKCQEKREEQRKEEEKGSKGQERKEALKERRVRLGRRHAGRKTQKEMERVEPAPSPLSLSPLLYRPLRGSVDNWA